jgi:hypothetical protein
MGGIAEVHLVRMNIYPLSTQPARQITSH